MGMITSWLVRVIDRANATDVIPKQLTEYLGNSSETTVLFPYGMYSNVSNGALGLMFFVGGNSEQRLTIPSSFDVRPDLEPGEIAIYRPDGDAIIKFNNAGDIAISTSANVTVDCVDAEGTPSGNVTVNCVDITATASGDMTLNCVNADVNATGNVTVDCVDITVTNTGTATVNSTGNVNVTAPTVAITGNLTVSGTIVATGEVTGNGKLLSTHTHSGNPPGSYSNSGGPVTGVSGPPV